ncbi:MAG: DUF3791 domain-containing protein [Bacteroidales bacterium]|jgi:iron-sulfur cluster repair protein YtfE (RIC family)|nr:DUF3791 domain-containing protein [Bacteroidales bacterium]
MLNLSDKATFFIFLLEKYAERKSMSASKILKIWEKAELIDYINAMYEQYHTERIENAIEDIDRKLS